MEVQNALCFMNCDYTRALVIVSLSSYFSSPERAFPGGDLWGAFPLAVGEELWFQGVAAGRGHRPSGPGWQFCVS